MAKIVLTKASRTSLFTVSLSSPSQTLRGSSLGSITNEPYVVLMKLKSMIKLVHIAGFGADPPVTPVSHRLHTSICEGLLTTRLPLTLRIAVGDYGRAKMDVDFEKCIKSGIESLYISAPRHRKFRHQTQSRG